MEETVSEDSLLTVRDLRIRLGTPPVQAVDGVSFDIESGEVLGLAGESGSGKSVTALALTRLFPPAARAQLTGSVLLDQQRDNLLSLQDRELRTIRGRRIAYIFQEPSASFNPVFTIRSQLEEVLRLAGVPANERGNTAREALEAVGIEPTARNLNAYPADFSGGMLQRMAIACAIAAQPDLLIADEPTTALDTSTQRRIIDLISSLNEEKGMAILFISHDLALLKQVAPRLLVMREGQVVEEGPARDLLYRPRHPYTRSLVSAIPKLRLPD